MAGGARGRLFRELPLISIASYSQNLYKPYLKYVAELYILGMGNKATGKAECEDF